MQEALTMVTLMVVYVLFIYIGLSNPDSFLIISLKQRRFLGCALVPSEGYVVVGEPLSSFTAITCIWDIVDVDVNTIALKCQRTGRYLSAFSSNNYLNICFNQYSLSINYKQ